APSCSPAEVRPLAMAALAVGRAAAGIDVAALARRHPQLCETTVLRHELHGRTGGPGDLGAAAGTHLDGVQHGADGDVAQGEVVTRLDVGARTGFHLRTLFEVLRSED